MFWAALMLLAAAFIGHSDYYEWIFSALLLGWLTHFLALQENGRSLKEEWACIRRWFSASK